MTAPLSLTDKQYQFLVGLYGPGLSYDDMLYKYRGNGNTKSLSDLNYTAYLGDSTKSLADNMDALIPGSGSLSDQMYADSSGGIVTTITNIVENPTPASGTNWLSNNASKWIHTYANNEISVDRQAAADVDLACYSFDVGLPSNGNIILKAGVNYQRSIEVWVDAAATVKNAGFTGGQVLVANQWNRVVQQFVGSGVTAFVMNFQVNMPGVGTGIHVKLRKSMLCENPTGRELAYADGNSPGWSWSGTANASTSSGPAIYPTIPSQTFKSAGPIVAAGSSVTTLNVPIPAGALATDTVLIAYGWGVGAVTTVTPSGAGGTFNTVVAPRTDTNLTWGLITSKGIAAGSNVTLTLGASQPVMAQAFVFSSDIGVAATVGSRGGASQNYVTAPAFTLGNSNRGVLAFACERSIAVGAVTGVVSTTGETVSQLSYSEQSADQYISFYLGRLVSAGTSVGPVTVTYAGASTNAGAVLIKEIP